MVPEAFERECAHCTELQKRVIEKMMCYLNNHQPEILKQVAAKFDPDGEYMKTYLNAINKEGNENLSGNPQQSPQIPLQQPNQNPQQSSQPNQQQPQQQNQQQSEKNQQQSKATVVPSTGSKDGTPATKKP